MGLEGEDGPRFSLPGVPDEIGLLRLLLLPLLEAGVGLGRGGGGRHVKGECPDAYALGLVVSKGTGVVREYLGGGGACFLAWAFVPHEGGPVKQVAPDAGCVIRPWA